MKLKPVFVVYRVVIIQFIEKYIDHGNSITKIDMASTVAHHGCSFFQFVSLLLKKWHDFASVFPIRSIINIRKYPIPKAFHSTVKFDVFWKIKMQGYGSHHS